MIALFGKEFFMSNTENKEKKSNGKTGIFVVVIVVMAMIICFLLMRSCSVSDGETGGGGNSNPIFDIIWDDNAEEGEREQRDPQEVQDELNRLVEEGMINISMNMTPVFENGESEGNLLIMNEKINRYPQVIEIYRRDTGELIYRSGLLAVGSRIDTAKLDVDLPAGTYPCIAYFNAVNPDTGALKGKAGAEIVITIKN